MNWYEKWIWAGMNNFDSGDSVHHTEFFRSHCAWYVGSSALFDPFDTVGGGSILNVGLDFSLNLG
jgi:hypothetical protein